MLSRWLSHPRQAGWLVAVLVASVAAILLVSYRAVVEWQRTAAALAERRADATVKLFTTALLQDMRGVQVTVLSDQQPDVTENASSIRYNLIASALARYPYPEVFFTWNSARPDATVFYSRSDRRPVWLPQEEGDNLLPVATTTERTVGAQLRGRISRDAIAGRRYSTFDVQLGSSRHQVVALLSYDDAFHQRLKSVFGFLVDLSWVREHYFGALATQVTRIGADGSLQLCVIDGQGVPVVGTPGTHQEDIAGTRRFSPLFFDPRLVAVDWPDDLNRDSWTTYARIAGDPAVTAANVGARRTLTVAAVMSVLVVLGLWLTLHAARASAQLAAIRSDFVSTVTHELKTPLATIQAISETLASARGVTPELSQQYGRFGVHEAKRLRRLIDNLLAYSRIADVASAYSFEPVAPSALIDATLEDFTSQFTHGGFDVQVDVQRTLPPIRADIRAMRLALGNLVDNALRYSSREKRIRIGARLDAGALALSVSDCGVGIPAEDLPLVTRKFFTGRRGDRGGSGLGLAMVDRIVADHGGHLRIESRVDEGTTVTLELPVAESRP